MRLTNSDWHEWAADGVTVRSFKATLDTGVITLFQGDRRLLDLQAPTQQTPWAESPPVEFDGHTFVLLARRLDRQRTLVDLFEDGRGLRTGRTLDETRAIGVPKTVLFDPVAFCVLAIYWSPGFIVLAVIRGLEGTAATLPIAVLFAAVCFLASLGASIVGRRALAKVQESGHLVGLRTGMTALAVWGFSFAVAALLILGPFSPWLRQE